MCAALCSLGEGQHKNERERDLKLYTLKSTGIEEEEILVQWLLCSCQFMTSVYLCRNCLHIGFP